MLLAIATSGNTRMGSPELLCGRNWSLSEGGAAKAEEKNSCEEWMSNEQPQLEESHRTLSRVRFSHVRNRPLECRDRSPEAVKS